MKNLVVAALLIGSAVSASALQAQQAPQLEALHSYTFDDYVAAYGKAYKTAEERAAREKTFNDNLKMIKAHNANHAKSWTMNVNSLTDMSDSEFNGLMGQIPSSRRNLLPYLQGLQTSSDVPSVSIPDAVDWRNKSVVTPVKNQGSCGSCWAFASTETMESHWAIATGQLLELSPQQVTSCAPNPNECGGSGGCHGATENLAFEYVVKSDGMTLAKDWPYTATDGTCVYPPNAPRVANFSSYVMVKPNDQEDMLRVVATKGPVTIGVWATPMKSYSGGIFDGCGYDANINVNHAVQLVGYGSENGVGYWIVRNSWGANWGEGGYIRVLRESVAKCGMDSTPHDGSACKNDPDTPVKVCGQCGILSESSYPVPKLQ